MASSTYMALESMTTIISVVSESISVTPTLTGQPESSDEEDSLWFWVYVGVPVAFGILCGILVAIFCFFCMFGRKRNRRKNGESLAMENSGVQLC